MAFPTTPFEDATDDYAAWATLQEEADFLDALQAESSRVWVTKVGESEQGRPIRMVAVGYPSAPSAKDLRDKNIMFVNACIHGDEPSGREALLQLVRDLAASQDSAVQAYLQAHPFVCIPTANPDGRAANTRSNSSGLDLNHHFISYQEKEVQAVAYVLRHYQPVMTFDVHEKSNRSGTDFETTAPPNTEIHPDIASLSETLNQEVQTAYANEGFSVGDYPGSTDAYIFDNNVGLRNSVDVLLEAYGQGATDGITRKGAVSGHKAALSAARQWHETNAETLAETGLRADFDSIEDGKNQVSIDDPPISSPPLGYELTDAQFQSVWLAMDRMRISSWLVDGSDKRYVPTGQPTKRLIPFLMDAAANNNEISATSVDTAPTLLEPPLTASGFKVRDVRDAGSSVSVAVNGGT